MELQTIQSKIHEIRGRRVMLDFDLATLYQVKTMRLNEAVKRNIKRFPDDFMFQLTENEYENLKSQIVTSNLISQIAISSWGGTRKLPYAFTEQGVAMLSGLLRSDVAIEVNISIMRAFVAMRQLILSSTEIREIRTKLRLLERNDDQMQGDINNLYAAIEELSTKPSPSRNPLGFDIPRD